MTVEREHEVTETIVALTSHLVVDQLDVVDLLTDLCTGCAQLLDIASAGLLLADEAGLLHVVAASSEATRNLELFQVQRDEGPCLDCYRSQHQVRVPDLPALVGHWPKFVPEAVTAGFMALHALPLQLNGATFGAMGLFSEHTGDLSDADINLAVSLAHVATVALVASRAAADQRLVTDQLKQALKSRIVLEQAKGLLAAVGDLDMDMAFRYLRRYTRDHNLGLTAVATSLISRELKAADLISQVRPKMTPRKKG